jgi:hypothetical protein
MVRDIRKKDLAYEGPSKFTSLPGISKDCCTRAAVGVGGRRGEGSALFLWVVYTGMWTIFPRPGT